jgi:hypothetical protein
VCVRLCVFQSLLITEAVLIMQYRHKKAYTIMGGGVVAVFCLMYKCVMFSCHFIWTNLVSTIKYDGLITSCLVIALRTAVSCWHAFFYSFVLEHLISIAIQ